MNKMIYFMLCTNCGYVSTASFYDPMDYCADRYLQEANIEKEQGFLNCCCLNCGVPGFNKLGLPPLDSVTREKISVCKGDQKALMEISTTYLSAWKSFIKN